MSSLEPLSPREKKQVQLASELMDSAIKALDENILSAYEIIGQLEITKHLITKIVEENYEAELEFREQKKEDIH